MARITVEDCLAVVDNRFELVLMATRRARQVAKGADALVEAHNDKPTVVALREIAGRKVTHEMIDEVDRVERERKEREALEWADVANVLRIQLERQNMPLFSSLREYNLAYGVTRELLDSLKKEVVIMHPGPINRGVELDSAVADGNESIILQQVENGVAIRMAVLYLLSGRKG